MKENCSRPSKKYEEAHCLSWVFQGLGAIQVNAKQYVYILLTYILSISCLFGDLLMLSCKHFQVYCFWSVMMICYFPWLLLFCISNISCSLGREKCLEEFCGLYSMFMHMHLYALSLCFLSQTDTHTYRSPQISQQSEIVLATDQPPPLRDQTVSLQEIYTQDNAQLIKKGGKKYIAGLLRNKKYAPKYMNPTGILCTSSCKLLILLSFAKLSSSLYLSPPRPNFILFLLPCLRDISMSKTKVHAVGDVSRQCVKKWHFGLGVMKMFVGTK